MSAFYAGLDVSDLTTAICVLDAKGQSIREDSVETNPRAIAMALKPYRRSLKIVGQESGAKAPWLHKELTRRRLPVVCIDARFANAALAAQRNKTDRNDAKGIAQILRAGWYNPAYVKSDEALRLRMILTCRRSLKRHARSIEMTLRMSVKVFGAQLRKQANRVDVEWCARADPVLQRSARRMIDARTMLLAEVKSLDTLISQTARNDGVCRRLMTAPGVGPLVALTFKAAVDDPTRFTSSRTVGAHFGLTPRRHQSGQSDYTGRISRMGDVSVRTALYEAAFSMLMTSKSDNTLRTWGLKLKAERGVSFACIAVARKLAVVLHRMWISDRDFDPKPT